jgi:hypothetical protein
MICRSHTPFDQDQRSESEPSSASMVIECTGTCDAKRAAASRAVSIDRKFTGAGWISGSTEPFLAHSISKTNFIDPVIGRDVDARAFKKRQAALPNKHGFDRPPRPERGLTAKPAGTTPDASLYVQSRGDGAPWPPRSFASPSGLFNRERR